MLAEGNSTQNNTIDAGADVELKVCPGATVAVNLTGITIAENPDGMVPTYQARRGDPAGARTPASLAARRAGCAPGGPLSFCRAAPCASPPVRPLGSLLTFFCQPHLAAPHACPC